MRVIVAGSRDVTDKATVMRALQDAYLVLGINPTTIISGAARGVDRQGELIAAEHKIRVERAPAKWLTLGRAAGHIRNAEMAATADALVAVWDGVSPGTKNMIHEARKRGLAVWVHMVDVQA